jgi:hypothetical protein
LRKKAAAKRKGLLNPTASLSRDRFLANIEGKHKGRPLFVKEIIQLFVLLKVENTPWGWMNGILKILIKESSNSACSNHVQ